MEYLKKKQLFSTLLMQRSFLLEVCKPTVELEGKKQMEEL